MVQTISGLRRLSAAMVQTIVTRDLRAKHMIETISELAEGSSEMVHCI